MEITYMMVGADGQQYGPVTLEQLKGWIREGRVTAVTQILRNDVNSWLPAAQYQELGLSQPLVMSAGAPPPLSAGAPVTNVETANLIKRAKSGAGWFFFIGALSAVNSVVLMSGSNWRFVVGLGITDIIAGFSHELGSAGMVIGLGLDVVVLAVFMAFGYFAKKGHSWSFIAGMVCYAADGAILLVLGAEMMNLIFHGIALVFMFLGLMANIKLKGMQRGAVAGAAARA